MIIWERSSILWKPSNFPNKKPPSSNYAYLWPSENYKGNERQLTTNTIYNNDNIDDIDNNDYIGPKQKWKAKMAEG